MPDHLDPLGVFERQALAHEQGDRRRVGVGQGGDPENDPVVLGLQQAPREVTPAVRIVGDPNDLGEAVRLLEEHGASFEGAVSGLLGRLARDADHVVPFGTIDDRIGVADVGALLQVRRIRLPLGLRGVPDLLIEPLEGSSQRFQVRGGDAGLGDEIESPSVDGRPSLAILHLAAGQIRFRVLVRDQQETSLPNHVVEHGVELITIREGALEVVQVPSHVRRLDVLLTLHTAEVTIQQVLHGPGVLFERPAAVGIDRLSRGGIHRPVLDERREGVVDDPFPDCLRVLHQLLGLLEARLDVQTLGERDGRLLGRFCVAARCRFGRYGGQVTEGVASLFQSAFQILLLSHDSLCLSWVKKPR